MRWALAVASLCVLVVHGIVLYDQTRNRWEDYQRSYFDQARLKATTAAERAAVENRQPKIEQTILTNLGANRVDRCQTCHIAADDPRFASYEQPLRTHPYSETMGDRLVNGRWQRRHRFSDFGCTSCHDGQGRGLDAVNAHGEDKYWPEPLLGYVVQANWRKEFQPHLKNKDYLQANCAQCHTEEDFRGTPVVRRGRQLFQEKGCYGCHRIEGISNGTLGPDLTEVGKRWKLDYLWESVVDPRANIATSFMPKFNLTDDEVKALVVFLKSRRGMNFAETALDRYRSSLVASRWSLVPTTSDQQPATVSAARGEKLVTERACVSCHKLGERDGGISPDLSYAGLMRDDAWLMDHFRNPRSREPDSVMPAFGFADADFQSIVLYLKANAKRPPQMPPAETYKTLCQRCHGEKGDGNGITALYLDPTPRDFTKTAFMTSKPASRFLDSIRNGVPGTSMPPFGQVLSGEQVQGVFDYVWQSFVREPRREIKARAVPEHNPVPMTAESVARGERTFLGRCTGCHGRKADGKGPNSLDISPRPRNLRNAAFVQSAGDRRLFESISYGVEGTAMPPWVDYGLSQNDIGDLVNFIRSLNQGKR